MQKASPSGDAAKQTPPELHFHLHMPLQDGGVTAFHFTLDTTG